MASLDLEWNINGVERYAYYVQGVDSRGKPRRRLKLEEEQYQPHVCKTLHEFTQLNKKVPLSLLACKNEAARLKDPHFLAPFNTYLAVGPKSLVKFWSSLEPSRRILATIAYEDCAVHWFSDMDWDEKEHGKLPFDFRSSEDIQRIQLAYMIIVSDAFQRTFGREFDWSDHHWESACTSSKLSLHLHVLSEASLKRSFYEAWAKQVLIPYIASEAKRGNQHAQRLGAMVTCSTANEFGKWKCLIDPSVLCKNHVLRLAGNRKGGGQVLEWIPSVSLENQQCMEDQVAPSNGELLFRGLVSYSITAAPSTWIVGFPVGIDKKDKKLNLKPEAETVVEEHESKAQETFLSDSSKTKAQQTFLSDSSKTSSSETNRSETTAERYAWMRHIRIPWFDQYRWPQPEPVHVGFLPKLGVPFVRYRQKNTTCPICTTKSGKMVKHSSNHCFLIVDSSTGWCTLKSTDPDCKKGCIRFELPWKLKQAIPNEPLLAARADLDYSCLAVDHDLELAVSSSSSSELVAIAKECFQAAAEPSKLVSHEGETVSGHKRRRDEENPHEFVSPLDQCAAFF